MASFFSSVRQGFGRGGNRGNGQQRTPPPSAQGNAAGPLGYGVANSPASTSVSGESALQGGQNSRQQPPFFFREEYSNLIVKGNFMTLAARPVHVELGEWLAHQVVEQYRLLEGMLSVIKVNDDKTGVPVCNDRSCPSMSASGHTYTWLDSNKRPIRIPAIQYIQLVQKWIMGKISDPTLFPTDTSFVAPPQPNPSSQSNTNTSAAGTPIPAGPTNLNASLSSLTGRDWVGKASGFPESFESDIRSIYRQMMRCYAHLYHGHWIEPFWHLGSYKELNTCFVHFVNVGKLFGLLADRDLEPMQPLVDIWIEKGLIPASGSGGQQQQQQQQQSGGQQQQQGGQQQGQMQQGQMQGQQQQQMQMQGGQQAPQLPPLGQQQPLQQQQGGYGDQQGQPGLPPHAS